MESNEKADDNKDNEPMTALEGVFGCRLPSRTGIS